MFCNNCGKEINEGTKFCNHCGASQEASAPQPTMANNTVPTNTPKKNNTLKMIIIAAVVMTKRKTQIVLIRKFLRLSTAVITQEKCF